MAMFYALCLFRDFMYIHVYAAFSKWGASVRLKLVKLFFPMPFFFCLPEKGLVICIFHLSFPCSMGGIQQVHIS